MAVATEPSMMVIDPSSSVATTSTATTTKTTTNDAKRPSPTLKIPDIEKPLRPMKKVLPRLVERNLPFGQSRNQIRVHHNLGWRIFNLVRNDLFHVLMTLPTLVSLVGLIVLWTGVIVLYGALYVLFDHHDPEVSCGLGTVGEPIGFGAAFAFSLETCTTVGYGLPSGTNAFFEEQCQSLQFIIYTQMLWSMIFNAILLAFLYTRLSRSSSRGIQVIFSEKAICTIDRNQIRFQIRLYDADAANPIVEAHVRLYAIAKHQPEPRTLRILHPCDELSSMLFLSLPSLVTHHVDMHSRLHPPVPDPEESTMIPRPFDGQGLILREADARVGNRDDFSCPICGEAYGTFERWVRHVRYQQIAEKKDGWPIAGSHLSITEEELQMPDDPITKYSGRTLGGDDETTEKDRTSWVEKEATIIHDVREHFENEISEVLCIVEGIDPFLSGTFQAVHSYQIQNIVFDAKARFRPCLDVSRNSIRVDLNRFHEIVTGDIDEGYVDDHGEAKDVYSRHRQVHSASWSSQVDGKVRNKRIRTTPSRQPS